MIKIEHGAPLNGNVLVDEGRVGKFLVSRQLIRGCPADTLFRFFANFIIVRAELLYLPDSIEYVAYSALFAVTDAGDRTPEYIVSMDENSNVLVEQI